jgi:hypothetical protein
LRRKYIYFVLGHLALIVPSMIVLNATSGNAFLGVLEITILVAAVLYMVAFMRRDEQGITAWRLLWRGGLTTIVCLPIWFLFFLVLSWLTGPGVLLAGFAFVLPLSAVSSGLTALLGLGLFSGGGPSP